MVAAFDEVLTQGIRRNNTIQAILLMLCQAEDAERKARSISYPLRIAKFPVHKNLETLSFKEVHVQRRLAEERPLL